MLRNSTNRPRLRRLVSAVAAVTATALTLGACSGAATGGGQATAKDASITVAAGDITAKNFNPFSATALQPTLGVIYEPLYWYNFAKQSDPTPILATGYSWNAAGTELTIKLRHGVKWNDGQPFTA